MFPLFSPLFFSFFAVESVSGSSLLMSSGVADNAQYPYFPVLPSFLPTPPAVSGGSLWRDYERECLYEEELVKASSAAKHHDPQLQTGGVSRSDDGRRKWTMSKEIPQQSYEVLVNSLGEGAPDSSVFPRVQCESGVAAFDKHFALGDVAIREAEQTANVEVFCCEIAHEIVNGAASLYASRYLDSVLCGFTALTVWDELVHKVSTSFLPFDTSSGDTYPDSGVTFSFLTPQQPACPPAGKGGNAEGLTTASNVIPSAVPIDKYSRYIIARRTEEEGSSGVAPGDDIKKQVVKPTRRVSRDLAATKSNTAPPGSAGVVPKSTPVLSTVHKKNNGSSTRLTKKKQADAAVGKEPEVHDNVDPREESDPLTTALHQLPPKYFSSSTTGGGADEGLSAHTSNLGASASKKTHGKAATTMIEIEGGQVNKNKVGSSKPAVASSSKANNPAYKISKKRTSASGASDAVPKVVPSHSLEKTTGKKTRSAKTASDPPRPLSSANKFVVSKDADVDQNAICINPAPGVTVQTKHSGKGSKRLQN
ncbi:hypothetical protein AGDE_14548 [Angomonas deanei]|uniref:Uncharacterized protein n=1 Tax=Angomonas deanei TaxID=59799 RepID=A0A7G2CA53_9TRYP|nr:hypothetical protein AGDE_14548 [Angomonas deanei]CAD2216439.1 hypothetical protein, conserved [Angomonas deanei]|eukprot:EPY20659.1 hypothetical protein AGDE_14548 [Angomonas deanei]